jgi:uncharacterized protein YcaQ
MYSLSKEEFRSFLIRYHSLDNFDSLSGKGKTQVSKPAAQVKKLMRRLGSVQYDPLNVVGRNPDLVFQSRIKDFTADLLEDLLYKERSLIDGWDKEMSIYPSAEWPCFTRIRKAETESTLGTLKYRGQEEVLKFLPQIMEEARKKGALRSNALKLGSCKENRWGHRQVSGAALDYLNMSGQLGVYSKKSAQKIYAPIENLLPEKIVNESDPFPNDDDFFEWYFLRRIGGIGAYWLRSGPGWLGHYLSNPDLRKKTLKTLEEKKTIVRLEVPEINETFYMRRKDLPVLNEKSHYDGAARFLAPLDNMLWDRLMVKKVFDFEYSWEVYVPAAKRKYGYYVLPVLYKNNLIARFEPVKYEKGRPLAVKNWWWEPSLYKKGPKIREAVLEGLENFAHYLQANGLDGESWKAYQK